MSRRNRRRTIAIRIPGDREVDGMIATLNKIYLNPKLNRLKIRLMANEVLRLLKPSLSYKDLNKLTGIPESVLCRYVRGNIVPSYEQALRILAKISLSIDIEYLLKELVKQERSNIIDLSRVLKDPYVIRLLTIILSLKLTGKNVTKIVATAEAVMPLATMLGIELNVPIVLVKKKAYPGVQYYTGIVQRSPKDAEMLFLDKDLIGRRDNIVVLADVVYTGRTLSTVLSMIEKAKANIEDIFVILALGNAWSNRLMNYDVKVLTHLPYPF